MTLTVYEHLEQGSSDWLQARAGIVTASVVGQLITRSTMKPAKTETARKLINHLAAERITNHVEESHTSHEMLRGILDEPIARDVYAKHYATVKEVGFMVRELDGGAKLGYSPDGLVGDEGLIEIKSRKAKIHLSTIIEGWPPDENYAQLQCGLLVSGRKWIDYCSYSSGLPFWVKRIHPDPAYQEAIVTALSDFEKQVGRVISIFNDRTKDSPPTERVDHFASMEGF